MYSLGLADWHVDLGREQFSGSFVVGTYLVDMKKDEAENEH